jgi:hypothetical protein
MFNMFVDTSWVLLGTQKGYLPGYTTQRWRRVTERKWDKYSETFYPVFGETATVDIPPGCWNAGGYPPNIQCPAAAPATNITLTQTTIQQPTQISKQDTTSNPNINIGSKQSGTGQGGSTGGQLPIPRIARTTPVYDPAQVVTTGPVPDAPPVTVPAPSPASPPPAPALPAQGVTPSQAIPALTVSPSPAQSTPPWAYLAIAAALGAVFFLSNRKK